MCCRLLVPSFYRVHTTVTFSTLITESDIMEENHLITAPTVFFLAFPSCLFPSDYSMSSTTSSFHIPCKFILFIILQSIRILVTSDLLTDQLHMRSKCMNFKHYFQCASMRDIAEGTFITSQKGKDLFHIFVDQSKKKSIFPLNEIDII